MLAAKEKLDDMRYLEELLLMYPKRLTSPNLGKLAQEIKLIRTKIATHDYEPLEKRRQMSIKRFGKESAYW